MVKEKSPQPPLHKGGKKQRFIIIDGNALIHRSFHALPPTMATKKGEMINAVYGFTAALLKAIREFHPEFVALTLDKKGPTFRHKEYKEYKATRVAAPDDLYKQIPRVKEVARVFNIPIYEMSGLEADDLIGTIAREVDGNIEKIILTGDLDTLQLVDKHTKVYTMSRGLSESVTYDEAAVKERYGLAPSQMIDYKSLRGDPSDNIPGVRGIGEKGAVALLQDFKTLEGVYKNVECRMSNVECKIKPRIKELLNKYKEDAFLSKKLATIKRDAKIDFKLENARFGDFDKEKLVKLFSELEFKSLLPRVRELSKKQDTLASSAQRNNKTLVRNVNKGEEKQKEEVSKFERNKKMFKYEFIDTDKEFKSFLKNLKKQKAFTFDTETSGFNPITDDLLGISFSWKKGEAYYVNIKSQKSKVKSQKNNLFNYKSKPEASSISTTSNQWLEDLRPVFGDEKVKKYGHNIKFDVRVMQNNGVRVNGVEFDTMIASYLLNPGTRQHNLDALTFTELGFEKISKEDLLGRGRDKISFSEVPIENLCLYSCEDADFTNRLVKKLSAQLKEQKLEKLFNEIEMPLVPVLAEMEDNGVAINKKFLSDMDKRIAKRVNSLEKKICRLAGAEFNVGSPKQLREILFEKLEISTKGITKTKTGFSTAAEELEKLADEHPIINLIQEYRELTKLLNTYIIALPELINKKTGRLHTSFNQAVTATGRLSSTAPNLQNIPIRTELGKEIRKAFVADKGYKILGLDYSQIELRLAAHMSGDPKMIKAFKRGDDIHSSTAAEINGVSLDEVTGKMRREAKAINFGILYGQGPHGLSRSADIPFWRAKEFIDDYFAVYKDVKKFIDRTIEKAKKDGYVETMFGRRRYLPEINSSVVMVRKGAERMAINTPLQGTAADLIKAAMIEVSRAIRQKSNKGTARMLLQVHDELLFEVKINKVDEVAREMRKIMEGVIKLKIPVEVDAEVGDNWGKMEELKI